MVITCGMCKLSRELVQNEHLCPIHGDTEWEDYEEFGGLVPPE